MMFGMFGFEFLSKVMSNAATDYPSARRFALVISAIFMCISLLILSIAYVVGATVAAEVFWAITIPLSLMAGVSYTSVERARSANRLPGSSPDKSQPLNEAGDSPGAGKQE